jgi:mono/diheme cytochrome c family protein
VIRGEHLARIYGCADCHGNELHGAFIEDFDMTSRNLTLLSRTFSDADFDRAIRHGLRPDGTSVAQYMPSDSFQFMPDADLADIIAYIRSRPHAGTDVPEPSYGLRARYDLLFGGGKTDVMWFALQRPALDLGPGLLRGREIAMTACGECHTTQLEGNPGDTPDLSLVASYDRADFFKLMRTGKAAGNRELRMMSATARKRFSNFTDSEIAELYDYLVARGRKVTGSGS